LTISPNTPEILNNLGTVYRKLGDKANALASFEKAITLRPNYAIARYNLAEAYEPTNPKRALSEYETYLALVEGIPDEANRIALVQQIWDSIALDAERVTLTAAQRDELARRADDDDANPDDTVPWEQVKAEALARWGR